MAWTRARTRRRATHLSIAIAIALATCAVQLLDPGNATRAGAFYTVAVAVASMSLGLRWGLAIVALSLGLDLLSDPQSFAGADMLARWPRLFVLIVVAITTARLTDRIRDALRASRQSEERFRRSFEDSHIGMAIVATKGEHAGAITEVNPALADLLRTPAEDLIGKKTIASFIPEEDAPAMAREMARLQSGEIPVLHREFEIVVPDGHRRWVSFTASMVRDEDGDPIYRISQIEDIDARRRAEDKLRWLADHDALTDLPNRRRFARELEAELGTRSRGAVVICDLDGFKQVNDTLGHPAGDRVLALVSELLRTSVRSGDIVARVGGDEFGVLLRRVDPDSVGPLVDKLVAQVDAGLELERTAEAPRVTLSAGSAWFDAVEGADPGELLDRADRAMYVVKQRHHRSRGGGLEGSEAAGAL
ncbi:diguanylate cyclase [Thermoleophilia bacterium SCSIO 60948]|nr:diguanylate cyclase [Thermoleophilia bacterium SCSIO 60948]